ncbi:hypothetical protein IE81DRAFT_326083 [Ceraceosorus guamensis]|uniref:Feruloyl esterase C n=1 Tax=Ceraceosorus guamensis TaxID=1522189 RepID=A0A316VQV2_9BASI|nr:hypothetical protein IE81DRAFT_326083 [Ceraceosorus guamensis]PWN39902.1 hypothetical protein IE81DRAFT_326083 [Ceraceosorus guamensis]
MRIQDILSAALTGYTALLGDASLNSPLLSSSLKWFGHESDACDAAIAQGLQGYQNITLRSFNTSSKSMVDRTHLVYLPKSYDGSRKLPTLLTLHPTQGNPQQIIDDSHLEALADREGIVLLSPRGGVEFEITEHSPWEGWGWTVPYVPSIINTTYPGSTEDMAYLLQVLDHAQSSFCVDKKLSYSFGHSCGARMSTALACDPHASNRFAAVSPANGIRAGPARPDLQQPHRQGEKACRPSHNVAIVSIHGTNDDIDPWNGNDNPQWGYSVPTALNVWSDILQCDSPLVEQLPGLNVTVTKSTYQCAGPRGSSSSPSAANGITQFTVTDGWHYWYNDIAGFDEAQALWDELKQHSL